MKKPLPFPKRPKAKKPKFKPSKAAKSLVDSAFQGSNSIDQKQVLIEVMRQYGIPVIAAMAYWSPAELNLYASQHGIDPATHTLVEPPTPPADDPANPSEALIPASPLHPRVMSLCAEYLKSGARILLPDGPEPTTFDGRAKHKIQEWSGVLIDRMGHIAMTSKQHTAAVNAARDLLDRAGLKEAFKVEVKDHGPVNALNLELLTEEELLMMASIRRKLSQKPVELPESSVRNITPDDDTPPDDYVA